MGVKHGRLHRESQGSKIFGLMLMWIEEMCRHAQEKTVELQIKLQKWKWIGHAVREDSFAIEKQAVSWNPTDNIEEQDQERAGGELQRRKL